MWGQMARIISEVRPKYAFIENSPMLTSRGLERVLADLAKMGFDAEWGVLSAADVGANHIRERIWIIGKSTEQFGFFSHAQHNRIRWWEQQSQSIKETNGTVANSRCELRSKGNSAKLDAKEKVRAFSAIHNQSSGSGQVSDTNSTQLERRSISSGIHSEDSYACDSRWWQTEPDVGRMADGVAAGVDRLKAIGNGQVPLCAATAWKLLKERIDA
jgi:DNA (cytosine-5)-methyltransferase 1